MSPSGNSDALAGGPTIPDVAWWRMALVATGLVGLVATAALATARPIRRQADFAAIAAVGLEALLVVSDPVGQGALFSFPALLP